jgi:hypothetical protein
MLILLLLFLFSGILLSALSAPLIMGKIPPNGLYGFRVKKTIENPDIWYPVNKYSGKWLLAAGLVVTLSAVCFFFVPGVSLDVSLSDIQHRNLRLQAWGGNAASCVLFNFLNI